MPSNDGLFGYADLIEGVNNATTESDASAWKAYVRAQHIAELQRQQAMRTAQMSTKRVDSSRKRVEGAEWQLRNSSEGGTLRVHSHTSPR